MSRNYDYYGNLDLRPAIADISDRIDSAIITASGSVRFDVSLSATWIVTHGFARIPAVTVVLSTGEIVVADVTATSTTVTVVFATSQVGFVLLS